MTPPRAEHDVKSVQQDQSRRNRRAEKETSGNPGTRPNSHARSCVNSGVFCRATGKRTNDGHDHRAVGVPVPPKKKWRYRNQADSDEERFQQERGQQHDKSGDQCTRRQCNGRRHGQEGHESVLVGRVSRRRLRGRSRYRRGDGATTQRLESSKQEPPRDFSGILDSHSIHKQGEPKNGQRCPQSALARGTQGTTYAIDANAYTALHRPDKQ